MTKSKLIKAEAISEEGSRNPVSLEAAFYGDPLCCWSYAGFLEYKKFLSDGKITNSRICMAGMIPDWKHYRDDVNNIERPAQMAPMWMQATQVLSLPLKHSVWAVDPPASSYPPCIAVKCAQLQSANAGQLYLLGLFQTLMVEGMNICPKSKLLEVANKLAGDVPLSFDYNRFKEDLELDKGISSFRDDLEEINRLNIRRFPSIIFSNRKVSLRLHGYQPEIKLMTAFEKFCGSN